MDLFGNLDYWLDLVTVTGLHLFRLVQVLLEVPTASAAFVCLPVTLGYWLPLAEQPALAVPRQQHNTLHQCLAISSS